MVEKQIKHQIFNSHLNQRGCPRTLSCPCLGPHAANDEPADHGLDYRSISGKGPISLYQDKKNLNHGCFSIYSGVNGRHVATATLDELLANSHDKL